MLTSHRNVSLTLSVLRLQLLKYQYFTLTAITDTSSPSMWMTLNSNSDRITDNGKKDLQLLVFCSNLSIMSMTIFISLINTTEYFHHHLQEKFSPESKGHEKRIPIVFSWKEMTRFELYFAESQEFVFLNIQKMWIYCWWRQWSLSAGVLWLWHSSILVPHWNRR